MTLPPAVAIAQVEMRFLKNGSQVENVFHVDAANPLDASDAGTIYNTVSTWITSTLRPQQSNDCTWVELVVKGVNAGDPRFVYPGDGLAGPALAAPTEDNVTFALKKNSGLSGRRYRGRFYHNGLIQGQVVASRLTPLYQFALISTYEALRTALDTAGFPMLVAYKDYSVPKPYPIVGGVVVTSITATDNIVDSQRRRLPSRGR